MKRKLLVGALASSVAVGGAIGASALSDSMTSTSSKSGLEVESEMGSQAALNTNKLIGVEELQDIVLSEVEGTIEEVELETEGDAHTYFEVEVNNKSKQYELYIDAYTGEVLKVEESDNDDRKHKAKQGTNIKTDLNTSTKSDVKSEPTIKTKTETKTTENQENQENQENKDNQENQDNQDNNQKQSEQSTISKEQAVKIALGVSAGKVAEVELDEDDNQLYYDIELKGTLNSEVKVDAYTGSILEIELDD
ncbi:PepSY domain-containing protein [Tenuibacillus multivorans]|uniref:Peptidase propeptide and YPEB domain-containing protein n=1 Tax=Tenuibacillus multivorans TaxID=237069 RepID=A0A1G9YGE6_9BACI|nr:PepSY domain-containing protein [Tenuibacillus multivorans]GEL78543.1 hypothetical protein TMU01_27780 [Tenuibacillus multivorans]SDN07626.1 Peptidase propeptide and YPEB domain-containing protein [Tenuibacillus multivorans]